MSRYVFPLQSTVPDRTDQNVVAGPYVCHLLFVIVRCPHIKYWLPLFPLHWQCFYLPINSSVESVVFALAVLTSIPSPPSFPPNLFSPLLSPSCSHAPPSNPPPSPPPPTPPPSPLTPPFPSQIPTNTPLPPPQVPSHRHPPRNLRLGPTPRHPRWLPPRRQHRRESAALHHQY